MIWNLFRRATTGGRVCVHQLNAASSYMIGVNKYEENKEIQIWDGPPSNFILVI